MYPSHLRTSGDGPDMPNNRCSKRAARRIECTYLIGQVRKFRLCICLYLTLTFSEQHLSEKVSLLSAMVLYVSLLWEDLYFGLPSNRWCSQEHLRFFREISL